MSWFSPAPAARLGWIRVAVGLFALQHIAGSLGLYRGIAHSPPAMFKPLGVTTLLSGPLAPDTYMAVVYATIALNVLFVIGLGTRVVAPLFAGALLFTLTYRTSWVQIYHSDNLLVLQALVLGLAPGVGDAVSLDKRLGWVKSRKAWEHTWPIALMVLLTLIAYFIAGVAKIANSDLTWAIGDNLRNQIAYDALNKELLGQPPSEAAYWAFQHPNLLMPGSLGALIIEVGAPLVFVNRRVSQVWAVGAFGMHWGIRMLMGIGFTYPLYAVAYACFFELEKPMDWLIGKLPEPARRLISPDR